MFKNLLLGTALCAASGIVSAGVAPPAGGGTAPSGSAITLGINAAGGEGQVPGNPSAPWGAGPGGIQREAPSDRQRPVRIVEQEQQGQENK